MTALPWLRWGAFTGLRPHVILHRGPRRARSAAVEIKAVENCTTVWARQAAAVQLDFRCASNHSVEPGWGRAGGWLRCWAASVASFGFPTGNPSAWRLV